jgi:hypothetical protein
MKHAVIFLNAEQATIIALPDDMQPKAGQRLHLENCLLEGRTTFHTMILPEGPADGAVLTLNNVDLTIVASAYFNSNCTVKFGSFIGKVRLSDWLAEQLFVCSREQAPREVPVYFIQYVFMPGHQVGSEFVPYIPVPSRELEQPSEETE